MIDFEELEKLGLEQGFSHVAPLDCRTIELKQEVRDMCAANTCGRYDKCWSCPPGCGTVEECQQVIDRYRHGIIVQTVGNLEDEMDVETMMETEKEHKKHFMDMEKILRKRYPNMRPVSAGSCTKCTTCTYPDAPCRFPNEAFSSMEAYGMLVTQVCKANNMEYYYGPCTLAYTSCFLLE